MSRNRYYILKSIVTIVVVAMLFSCTNNSNEVRALFLEKNLPIGVSKNINLVYKDSGRITMKLKSPWLNDYSNRKEHPFNEFPEGLKIISFKNKGKDSVSITSNYGLSYSKTLISELKDSVVIINYKDNSKLETSQLFWDQNTDYFFSEKKFKLTTETGTFYGIGFESKKDLSNFLAKKLSGSGTLASEN